MFCIHNCIANIPYCAVNTTTKNNKNKQNKQKSTKKKPNKQKTKTKKLTNKNRKTDLFEEILFMLH